MAEKQNLRKDIAARVTYPIVQLISRTPITPNTLTWIGFALAVAAAVVIYLRHPFAGGWVVLVAGAFDMLDGALARLTNRITAFGAALDSTLDRLSEAVLLVGIIGLSVGTDNDIQAMLAGGALVFSFMVSYVRARGEGLGLEMKEGWFTRTERVIVLALGLLLSGFTIALPIALGIIVVLSFVTAGQRLFLVWQKTRL